MSTDISMFLEVRISGEWHFFKKFGLIDRNYNLFGILADVRNYNNLNFISKPRGLPQDLSKESLKYIDEYFCYGSSYLSLKEFLDFNWEQIYIEYDDSNNIIFQATYREMCESFFEEEEKNIKLLSTKYKPEDVRLIFSFDC